MKKLLFLTLLFLCFCIFAQPRLRPSHWATPIIGTPLENFYKVSDKLYRSEQPEPKAMDAIQSMGITNVLNLRKHHTDSTEAKDSKLILNHVKMNASSVDYDDIFQSLYRIKQAKGPVVVHCWHGSDRTGTIVAAYRMVFQDWSKADAIDEFQNGGYGFHEKFFSNLLDLLNNLDIEKLKKQLGIEIISI